MRYPGNRLGVDRQDHLGQVVCMTQGPKVTRLTVGDIMTTPVVALAMDASVKEARVAMLDNRGSALPIVDSRRRPTGIVTKSDLVASTTDDVPIAVLMTTTVLTCATDTPVLAAARKMGNNDVHHLVVVADGVIVGIVGVFDLLKLLDELGPSEGTDR